MPMLLGLISRPTVVLVAVIGLLTGGLAIQSARLAHALGSLAQARAALINPETHRRWQDEALAASRQLEVCAGARTALARGLRTQAGAVEAIKRHGVEASARAAAAVAA